MLLICLLGLYGCDKNSITAIALIDGAVTLSGRVVDGRSGVPLPEIIVSIKINGDWKRQRSSDVAREEGDFVFANLPGNADFILQFSDLNNQYATTFLQGRTPTVSSQDSSLSSSIGTQAVYPAVKTTLVVKEAVSNSGIAGLSFSVPVGSVLTENMVLDDIATQVATDEGEGLYTFLLPDNQQAFAVNPRFLQTDDQAYLPLGMTWSAGETLAQITAGEERHLFMVPKAAQNLQLVFHLVDEQGEDFSLSSSVLPVTGKRLYYAEKSAEDPSEYLLNLSAEDAENGVFSFTIGSLDSDQDGVADTAAEHIRIRLRDVITADNRDPLTLDQQSFGLSYSLTQPVQVHSVLNSQSVYAEVLSREDDFIAGVAAKLILGFDRPVSLLGSADLQYTEVLASSPEVSVAHPAPVFADEDLDSVVTQVSLSVNDNHAGQYEYTNTAGDVGYSAVIADSQGLVASPFETLFDKNGQIIQGLSVTSKAGQTIWQIEANPDLLQAHNLYQFSVAAQGVLSDTPVLLVNQSLRARASTGLSSLGDLKLDDGDFRNTQTRQLSPASQPYLSNIPLHADQYTVLTALSATSGSGTPAVNYRAKYLTAPTGEISGAGYDPVSRMPEGVYLVSPVKLEGVVKILDVTVQTLQSGVEVSEKRLLSGQLYGVNYDSESFVYGDASELINNLTESARYLLTVPENHYVNDTALQNAFGFPHAAGFDISQIEEGVHYLYTLPIEALTGVLDNGEFIKQMTLEFHLRVAGQILTGSQSYTVH